MRAWVRTGCLLGLVACGVAWAQEQEPVDPPAVDAETALAPAARDALEEVRTLLVELEFEQALARLEILLAADDTSEEDRFAAWELRSQTHAALGNFDAAEEDYRRLLPRRPDWRPDPAVTPKKAMARFDEVRAETVGGLRVTVDPADALVVVDGEALAPQAAPAVEPLALLAGAHTIRVERRGYDAVEQPIEIAADEVLELTFSLIPNARTVILRTEPEGVEVWLDGEPVGVTARDPDRVGVGEAPAELTLPDLPLGEHRFELRKDCYRPEVFVDALNVDLLDRSPKRYPTTRLVESYVRIEPRDGVDGAVVLVDGEPAATLPTDAFLACPGERLLEVTSAGRTLWRARRTLAAGPAVALSIAPRPNVAWIGIDGAPRALAAASEGYNRFDVGADPSTIDFAHAESWGRLGLDREIDLAIAPAGRERQGLAPRWWLYSPVLRLVALVDEFPLEERPSWSTTYWGWELVDDEGVVRVATVDARGPAGRAGVLPGVSIAAVAGTPPDGVAGLERVLAGVAAGRSLAFELALPDGTRRSVEAAPDASPLWRDGRDGEARDALRAAWAVTDAAVDGTRTAPALANLALLLEAYGDARLAASTWRRVRVGERAGVGEGTARYYLGRALQRAGNEREAVDALREAVRLGGRVHDDGGPPVAPAARDRLADLGEAP